MDETLRKQIDAWTETDEHGRIVDMLGQISPKKEILKLQVCWYVHITTWVNMKKLWSYLIPSRRKKPEILIGTFGKGMHFTFSTDTRKLWLALRRRTN